MSTFYVPCHMNDPKCKSFACKAVKHNGQIILVCDKHHNLRCVEYIFNERTGSNQKHISTSTSMLMPISSSSQYIA